MWLSVTLHYPVSFTSSFDPGIWLDSPGMKILRDEKISPEMGGSESGNTLSILNEYESWNWTYNQRHWKIFRVPWPTFWSPRLAIFSFVIYFKCVTARVARMRTFGNSGNRFGTNGNGSPNLSAIPYWSCTVKYAVCLVIALSMGLTFLRASAVVKLAPTSNSAAVKMASVIRGHWKKKSYEQGHVNSCVCPMKSVQDVYIEAHVSIYWDGSYWTELITSWHHISFFFYH